jgi:hypothetical protein
MSTDTITARGGYDEVKRQAFIAIEEPEGIEIESWMDVYEAIFHLRVQLRKAGFDVTTFQLTCKLKADEEE